MATLSGIENVVYLRFPEGPCSFSTPGSSLNNLMTVPGQKPQSLAYSIMFLQGGTIHTVDPIPLLHASLSGAVNSVNLVTAAEPVRVTATLVSGTLFETLGISPQQGRWIDAADDREGAPLAIVISDGLWRRAFGGSPDVIGRETKMEGAPATVVGIMPPRFAIPSRTGGC
jgi:hypothetical protein